VGVDVEVKKPAAWAAIACAIALRAVPAAAEQAQPIAARAETSVVIPRFTLIELQYPQGVAASAGTWIRIPGGDGLRPGLVADAELGLSGSALDLGVGVSTSPSASYEKARSIGVQGVLLRTWPWWSPWLPTSATYGGAEIFGHFFAVRCSLGLLWSVDGATLPARSIIGGCGLGLP
jgi:hypothetical protein